MSSSNSDAAKPGIYFGFKTALEIARAVGANDLIPARGAACKLPSSVAKRTDVSLAINNLEARYPHLHITKPASLLVSTTRLGRDTAVCEKHSCSLPLSSGSFFRVAEGVYIAAPALSLIQLATLNGGMISLLECAYEMCGTYQSVRTAASSTYQVPPLTSTRALQAYASRNKSLNGAQKLLRSLRYVTDNSASPRETKLALVLGLPQMYGGYGLGIPRLNYGVSASSAARALSGKSHFYCDLCWPEAKLDVEYQSREIHAGEVSRIGDSLRANALSAMGWTVIGITNVELNSLTATHVIANTIRRAIGKRSKGHVTDFHSRKIKLRQQLKLPVMPNQSY